MEKKVFSKSMAWLLSVVMMFGMIVISPLTANASTGGHTQAEAVAWAQAQVGKYLDYDGAYGSQCVDLIAYYYQYLGNRTPGGNGCDYCRNALPSGWQRITNYSGYTPEPGDICVWDSYAEYQGVYGHVGIVVGGDSSRINTIEQNVDGSATINFSRATAKVSCFIRPDFVSDTTAPTISDLKAINVSGESFTIQCQLNDNVGVTRVWLNIYGPGGSNGYGLEASNGTFSHTINTSDYGGAGDYSVHIYAFDAAGNETPNGISFQAYSDTEKPVISDVKAVDVSGESFTIQCQLSDNVGVTRVWLIIYSPNGETQFGVPASNGEFRYTIRTSEYGGEGEYSVGFYAFDAAENGTKGLVEHINAISDTIAPSISNSRAENVSKDSFEIVCDLSDNVGITRVWLIIYSPNGEIQFGVPASNGEFRYTIRTSEYGGEGEYAVGFYAFDAAENGTSCTVNGIKAYVDYNISPTSKSECNGHTYEYYDYPLKWSDAYKFCEKKGGHLVTINSKEENDFISNMLYEKIGSGWVNVLTGGKTFDHETWFWITGEPFGYMNWSADEPDISDKTNDSINMIITSNTSYLGKWNTNNSRNVSNVVGFICEYDNNIDASKYNPVYKENYNGHEYWFFDEKVDWQTAKKVCEAKGGYLAIPNDAEENEMINSGVKHTSWEWTWLGITDVENEGVWKDVKGNIIQYTNWSYPQPDNYNGTEDYVHTYGDGSWNDANTFGTIGYYNVGFVCEFDDLCTGSGHNYEEKVIAPTTTSEGYTLHTCKRCGHSYKSDIKPMLVEKLVNSSTVSGTKITLGNKLTVNAKASGGTGDYTYAVYYKKSSAEKWSTAQSYKANATISFKPAAAVKYDVCVKIKDSKGTIAKQYFTVTVTKELVNSSIISAETVKKGSGVTVTAKATGGTGKYTYGIYYKKAASEKWTTAQSYGTNTTVTIKPAAAVKYDICVKVKDSSGKIVKKYFTLTVTK